MICVRYYKNGDTDPLGVRQTNLPNQAAAEAAIRELQRDGFTVIESFDPDALTATRTNLDGMHNPDTCPCPI
jgi:hypothetical protein